MDEPGDDNGQDGSGHDGDDDSQHGHHGSDDDQVPADM